MCHLFRPPMTGRNSYTLRYTEISAGMHRTFVFRATDESGTTVGTLNTGIKQVATLCPTRILTAILHITGIICTRILRPRVVGPDVFRIPRVSGIVHSRHIGIFANIPLRFRVAFGDVQSVGLVIDFTGAVTGGRDKQQDGRYPRKQEEAIPLSEPSGQ